MTAARIIGIGSPFGSDRLGWEVIDLLQASERLPDTCELVKLDRPGTGLLSYLEQGTKTVIIDAIQGCFPEGEIVLMGKDDIPGVRTTLSSHGIGLTEALHLAETLNQLPDELHIVGLEVGEDINRPPSAAHLSALADHVTMMLK